jgi:hypothetical protein
MWLLMFQASLPASYEVEVLHTATYLLNLRPRKTLSFVSLHFPLFSIHPDVSHFVCFWVQILPQLVGYNCS